MAGNAIGTTSVWLKQGISYSGYTLGSAHPYDLTRRLSFSVFIILYFYIFNLSRVLEGFMASRLMAHTKFSKIMESFFSPKSHFTQWPVFAGETDVFRVFGCAHKKLKKVAKTSGTLGDDAIFQSHQKCDL